MQIANRKLNTESPLQLLCIPKITKNVKTHAENLHAENAHADNESENNHN